MQHSFEMLPLDVDKDESVAALVNQIIDSTGRIDLLVNNAGRGLSPAGAEEFSLEQAQAIFNTNFFRCGAHHQRLSPGAFTSTSA
ncbi:SDR family NAD(P)-dependent oxidoreductase [Halopseudomonas pachastrellae]|nr:SDR family NAD(P)-dependent oxidoreductase [Halopseudomonas pachastrellae]